MTADHEAQRQAASPMSDYERGLRDAWQAVDAAIRPLGYGPGVGSNSPWNKGYEQAKNEGLNAILALMEAQRGNPQRQAATADSQATDQGALDAVRLQLTAWSDDLNDSYRKDLEAERILSALAEAGYTVVKTEALETLYADLLGAFPKPREDTAQAFLNGYRRCLMKIIPSYRPGVSLDWCPLPEGSADRGSEEGGER